jgi:hypothetical protein
MRLCFWPVLQAGPLLSEFCKVAACPKDYVLDAFVLHHLLPCSSSPAATAAAAAVPLLKVCHMRRG